MSATSLTDGGRLHFLVSFRLSCNTISDVLGVDPLTSSNESNPRIASPHASAISTAMSGISVDDGTESDEFISFPTTPADDDTFFLQDSYSFPASPHVSTTIPGPSTLPGTANAPATRTSPQTSVAKERHRMQTPELSPPPEAYSCPVKGMYRLLDLITELGSSGLVDKIVIAQQSLQAFINTLSPGAYSSITKVNFKKLDNCSLKPLGIYGSKEEIVRFLREIHAVDDNIAGKLLMPQDNSNARGAEPILRPGLYVVRSFVSTTEEQAFVLYWPEDTTWDDQAVSTVERNRVTLMRYLTKLCDQVVCLLSSEHLQTIVWGDEDGHDVSTVSKSSGSGRLFDFVVAKTNDQEENVAARPGFTMDSPLLVYQQPPPRIHIDHKDLSPRLLYGETVQGFMTAEFKKAEMLVEKFVHSDLGASQIRLLLGDDVVLCLSEKIDDKSLETLMDVELDLRGRFPNEFAIWERCRKEIKQLFQETCTGRQKDTHIILERDLEDVKVRLREAVIIEVLEAFPVVRREAVLPKSGSIESARSKVESNDATHPLYDFFRVHPKSVHIFQGNMRTAIEKGIKDSEFRSKKERILILCFLLEKIGGVDRAVIQNLADAVLNRKDRQAALSLPKATGKEDRGSIGFMNTAKAYAKITANAIGSTANQAASAIGSTLVRTAKSPSMTREEALWRDANNYASSVSDSHFLSQVNATPVDECLRDTIVEAEQTAYTYLRKRIKSLVDGIGQQFLTIQKAECDKQIQREIASEEDKELGILRSDFVHQVENSSRKRCRSSRGVYVDSFAAKGRRYSSESYSISGRKESQQNQEIGYYVHRLQLRAEQKHNLQLDPSFVPTPVLSDRLTQSFCVSSETTVKYAHLLEGDRILLGLVDSQGNVMIFLDKLSRIDAAIKNKSHAKFFHQDKIGPTCLFAFDESKRMLAVYASARMQLHVFVFDEELKSLRGLGVAMDLLPFYNTGVFIVHACFVHGSEEILFVDSSAQARIFSLISLQPKPASLNLSQMPRAVYSSPDGSCVLAVQEEDGVSTLTAYHWSTFASTNGISVTLPDFPVDLNTALLTSIINRNNIHLIGLDLESRSCRSVVLDITRRVTEFTFRERRSKAPSGHGKHTVHNCLINCHADVWTRFPVVPAVKRHTITSLSERQQKTLVFVANGDGFPFSSHFLDLIHSFERASRKPTGDELKGISVSARTFDSFSVQFLSSPDWPVSRFRAGEWLADLLCLIPIHIAITHENRFVPLKDGVVSAELEKSLLGAEVNKIVDSLSLGWYESIFQSYWASKPVKVVSSMGEQSVGKSFTLNHLVDTSFAGSAMRTTEGVWMSVSPTDDALIVALDFEGKTFPTIELAILGSNGDFG